MLVYTAQRRGEVVRMGWQQMNGGTMAVRQQKTGAALVIPVHPELARVPALVSRSNLTFLLTERGAPFTAAGFGNWFRDRCNQARRRNALRTACAKPRGDATNANCSTDQIKAMTWHRCFPKSRATPTGLIKSGWRDRR